MPWWWYMCVSPLDRWECIQHRSGMLLVSGKLGYRWDFETCSVATICAGSGKLSTKLIQSDRPGSPGTRTLSANSPFSSPRPEGRTRRWKTFSSLSHWLRSPPDFDRYSIKSAERRAWRPKWICQLDVEMKRWPKFDDLGFSIFSTVFLHSK